jgi:hypothetical protein
MDAHTTADDPTRYRSKAEVEKWARRDPICRFRQFLLDRHLLTGTEDQALYEAVNAEIKEAIESYETLPPPNPCQQFSQVYAELPAQLQRQQAMLLQELESASRNGDQARQPAEWRPDLQKTTLKGLSDVFSRSHGSSTHRHR